MLKCLKKIFSKTPVKIILLSLFIFFIVFSDFSLAATSMATDSSGNPAPTWWNPISWVKSVGATLTDISYYFTPIGLMDVILRLFFMLSSLILGTILYLVAWLFEASVSLTTSADMTIITNGWNVSLQLANSLFILILLAIAIGTILRLDTINKKLIPTFIMVALLINFSMVIGNVIIDLTNTLALSFSNQITPPSGNISDAMANALNVNKPTKALDDNVLDQVKEGLTEHFSDIFIQFLFQFFVNLISIFVYAAGVIYMIVRTFTLWFLLMIAPLAWIALLIPNLKQHWSKWWSQFIRWSIFAPAYLFFLYLGIEIGENSFSSFLGSHNDLEIGVGSIKDFGAMIIQTLIVAFTMLAGTKVASGLGITTSNFVINYANKMKGAASKKFSDLRSKSPLSAEKLGEKFGGLGARGLAAIPGVGRLAGYRRDEVGGRLELDRQKQRQADMEKEKLRHTGRMAGMDENQKRAYLENLTNSTRSGTGTTSLEQAAAINMLMEDKVAMENFSEVEQGYMRQAVAATTSSTQRNNIVVPYSSSLKAHAADTKESREKYKKGVEREMGSLASEDIAILYQMAQHAMSTGITSPKDAAAMRVLQDRKNEAAFLLSRTLATPEDRAKFWNNAKLGIEAAEKGKSSTSYIK